MKALTQLFTLFTFIRNWFLNRETQDIQKCYDGPTFKPGAFSTPKRKEQIVDSYDEELRKRVRKIERIYV